MNEALLLRGAEPRKILQNFIEQKTPAIMSYLSRSKWHVAKVQLANLTDNGLSIQLLPNEQGFNSQQDSGVSPQKQRPINIQLDQPVGISIKHRHGKFIFETKVVGFEPSLNPKGNGTISLAIPDQIKLIQRRNYFRVDVPMSLKVNVVLWHRNQVAVVSKSNSTYTKSNGDRPAPDRFWEGDLIDISAGGAQIILDAKEKSHFKEGQFIGMRFTPLPYETPLMLNTQVRNIIPTADNKQICVGVQVVGLESSTEGHQLLQRLCSITEQYYKINQSNAKQQDFQSAISP